MRPVSFIPIRNCCNFLLTHPPLGIDMLEGQVKEAKQMVEESDIKYDEIARKSAMVEGDLQRTEERADTGENTIINLEQELQDIGENLKSLEVAEEKAQQREEEYKRQMKSLFEKLKNAEARYLLLIQKILFSQCGNFIIFYHSDFM